MAACSKLAVLGLNSEKSGPPIEGKHPGTIGTSERQVATGRHSSSVCELHHRVLYVADYLVIFLQELLQLLYSVLENWDLALNRTLKKNKSLSCIRS